MKSFPNGSFSSSDFATLLDEVIAAAEQKDEEAAGSARPSIPFDLMNPSLGAPVADANAAADYLFAAADRFAIEPETPPIAPELPSMEPDAISLELGLTGREAIEDLDRLRREFAFANHPDRVSADLHERAIVRMQIANQLIDDAKRKARK